MRFTMVSLWFPFNVQTKRCAKGEHGKRYENATHAESWTTCAVGTCWFIVYWFLWVVVDWIHSSVHSKMLDFNWWDGLWPETEWKDRFCLHVSGEAGIRLQGECAADIARTVEPTGQRPKNNKLFQPEAQFVNLHWSFTWSPKQEVWLCDFRLLRTFWGITVAQVVSPLWVVFCDPAGGGRTARR